MTVISESDYHKVYLIDTGLFGQEAVASFLVVSKKSNKGAIIETASSHNTDTILKAIKEAGLTYEDIVYVIVTHVHLDHAGGAGSLLSNLPNSHLICHERGKRHMIDPRKLIQGSTEVYGEEFMKKNYLPIIGISEIERVEEVTKEGKRIKIGEGCEVELIQSPGHAPHHIQLFLYIPSSFIRIKTKLELEDDERKIKNKEEEKKKEKNNKNEKEIEKEEKKEENKKEEKEIIKADFCEGLFTGDSVGAEYPFERDYSLNSTIAFIPQSTPPQFDPPSFIATLKGVKERNPFFLFLTHFGVVYYKESIIDHCIDVIHKYTSFIPSVEEEERILSENKITPITPSEAHSAFLSLSSSSSSSSSPSSSSQPLPNSLLSLFSKEDELLYSYFNISYFSTLLSPVLFPREEFKSSSILQSDCEVISKGLFAYYQKVRRDRHLNWITGKEQ